MKEGLDHLNLSSSARIHILVLWAAILCTVISPWQTTASARSRKRKSSSNDGGPCSLPSSPPPPREKKQKCEELRRIIYPTFIPNNKFEKMEQMFLDRGEEINRRNQQVHNLKVQLKDQEDETEKCGLKLRHTRRQWTDVGKETNRRERQVHDLRKELINAEKVRDRQNDKLFEQEKNIKQLQHAFNTGRTSAEDIRTIEDQAECIADLERVHEEQETVIQLSTAVFGKLHQEREQHTQMLFERDARIETLNDQIYQMTTALPDQAAHLALEAQAQRHLSVMQRLQAGIAERDAEVERLGTEHAVAMEIQEVVTARRIASEVKAMQKKFEDAAEIETAKRISSEVRAVNKKYDGLGQRAQEAERKVAKAERRAEVAIKRAEELKMATEDQGKLIHRLLETNRKLSSQQA